MAEKEPASAPSGSPTFSEADMSRARQWFKKADDLRDRRDYDYAIECYITGLGYWPEAVEEGHMPLRSLAIQRQQTGGKKPGLMDSMKRSMTGKDAKKAMLNAEYLLAMDPSNAGYADGVLKNANRANFLQTVKWIAPIVLETLKQEKKINKSRFKSFRDTMVDAAGKADEWGEGALETWLLEKAVQSLEFAIMRAPTDEDLKNEQRDLAGKLTIARGKYEDAGDFRDSLRDAEAQKLLHDAERGKQGEDTLETLLQGARKAWEDDPESNSKFNAYIDALVKTEQRQYEDQAIKLLTEQHAQTRNYSYKMRADDIRLRQLTRQARALRGKAQKSGADSDKQQFRLAAMEQRQVAVDVYRERVAQYPTDLRLKFQLGRLLFEAGEYDEAIPVLQAAQDDPRHRIRAQVMIGRAFFEKGSHRQAAEVLRETYDKYDLTDDLSKEMLYWLGRAHEAAGNTSDAEGVYGKLLRQDYNYMDGDARRRLEELQK